MMDHFTENDVLTDKVPHAILNSPCEELLASSSIVRVSTEEPAEFVTRGTSEEALSLSITKCQSFSPTLLAVNL